MRKYLAGIFLLLLAFTTNGLSQEQKREVVTTRDFKGKVFELKHRDPNELFSTLRPLLSGFAGSDITSNNELRTITVRDFPENIATIEDAIKRLDVPRQSNAEPSVELSLHVLLANTQETGKQLPGETPSDLKDVIKQLQNTFAFRNYHLVTTITQRAVSKRNTGNAAMFSRGNAVWYEIYKEADGTSKRSGDDKAEYQYQIREIIITQGATGPAIVRLDNFSLSFGGSHLQTNLEVKDGEKLVVGSSTYGNKALILILTVKVLK